MKVTNEDLVKFAEIYEMAEEYAAELVCVRHGGESYIEDLTFEEGTFEAKSYTYGSGCGGDSYNGVIWFDVGVLEDPEAHLHKERMLRDKK